MLRHLFEWRIPHAGQNYAEGRSDGRLYADRLIVGEDPKGCDSSRPFADLFYAYLYVEGSVWLSKEAHP